MTVALTPVITKKGLAAIFSAQNDGFAAQITEIRLGEHGHTPSKSEIGLTQEKMRLDVADGERVGDYQIHLTGLASGDAEFWVREVGFYLSDGTMFAVWSDENPLAYKSALVDLLLAFDLGLEALPAQSVTVLGTGANLSLAAWGEQFIASVTQGVSDATCTIKNTHWNMQLSEKLRVMG